MIEIGRLCIKIAGRDAGNKCIVVDTIDNNNVLIDGNVRRKKCNIKHLEPLKEKMDIKKGASHDIIIKEFKKSKIPIWSTKPKEKTKRPRKQRKTKKKMPNETGKKEKIKTNTQIKKESDFVSKKEIKK